MVTDIDCVLTEKAITTFISEYTSKAGLKGGVLGLSGGLDSSLVASLAVKAFGRENVLGLILPYRDSSPASKEHAELLAQNLKIRTMVVDISSMADGYKIETDRIRFGNLLARIRMSVIFDISHRDNLIVLGTSNKTEMLIGYTTWFGDNAAGMYPIGDLYKSQVRAMASHMSVPSEIIDKPPSADLWKDQTDENEIGLSYETLDYILYKLVDQRMSTDDLVDKGIAKNNVERVFSLVKKSQFKRSTPPICKLSSRTINTDFEYLSQW